MEVSVKNIVITGGTGGIAVGIARHLLKHGAEVNLNSDEKTKCENSFLFCRKSHYWTLIMAKKRLHNFVMNIHQRK